MAKLTLNDISAGYISITTYNGNNTLLEAALENTLSRDGTSPNAMGANLDMNSFRITNLVTAVNDSEPVTLGQANTLANVTNPLTQQSVGAVLYPRTAVETSAGVTPTNFWYAPGNIKRYGAVGDANGSGGGADDTAAIQKAIDYAKFASSSQTEAEVIYPAGAYNVTSLNYVGANRTRHVAEGAVIFYGISSAGTSIINIDGDPTSTTSIDFIGNFSAQIATGGGYVHGIRMSKITNSRQKLSCSGAYTGPSCVIKLSFDNVWDLVCTNSRTSGTVVCIEALGGTINRNNFLCRVNQIPADLTQDGTGLLISGGIANVIEGDFSSIQTGVELRDCLGTTLNSPYFETIKTGIKFTSNTRGTVVNGGYYDVGQDGAAFDLSSSQHTTIISPHISGDASKTNRTAFILGTAAFGLSVIDPDIHATNIDTVFTGTWRGGTGGLANTFDVLAAQWIGFPPTQIKVSDVNTLDDYEEGPWTPVLTASTVGDLSVTYAGNGQKGYYVKVGQKVTVTFTIQTSAFTHTTAAGDWRITGLPFSSNSSAANNSVGSLAFSGITKASFTQFSTFIDPNTSFVYFFCGGSAQTLTSLKVADMPTGGSVILYGELTYFADT